MVKTKRPKDRPVDDLEQWLSCARGNLGELRLLAENMAPDKVELAQNVVRGIALTARLLLDRLLAVSAA
jgi:hypothetical protein